MIASAIVGSIIGAKIISKMDIMKIRVVMGVALLIVAAITLCKINGVGPFGLIGTARGLTGALLVIGVIVIFQPELRKALEQLGQKKFVSNIIPFDSGREVQERFNDKTINELVKACFDMGEVKTGALIVIEEEIRLDEYVRTGINIDGILTSQLLINIFEHNTPLHDGAVIVRGNRVVAATCYLPLSDNMELSKQLGTRHRAGVGISEATDSLTIIVSEETGQVSVARGGELSRGLNSKQLREVLVSAQNKKVVDNGKLRNLLKGRVKHEEKSD